jgi:hypothetical protein
MKDDRWQAIRMTDLVSGDEMLGPYRPFTPPFTHADLPPLTLWRRVQVAAVGHGELA